MEKFTTVAGVAASMLMVNIDTDMIVPKQFLKSAKRSGYEKALFHDLRYDDEGNERADFVLNNEPFREAKILLAGENFGCGSSREQAVWALLDFGIRCVIAPSFSSIFENNCANNGILTVRLSREEVLRVEEALSISSDKLMQVDLPNRRVAVGTTLRLSFSVDPYRAHRLLHGLDAIAMTLMHSNDIACFEVIHWRHSPWLAPRSQN